MLFHSQCSDTICSGFPCRRMFGAILMLLSFLSQCGCSIATGLDLPDSIFSLGGTDATATEGQPPIESAQEAMLGPGCNYPNKDGSNTNFAEGQSMGSFRTIDTCMNNVPDAFPCFCVSGAPDQTVCPYCIYRDAFNMNICGRSGENLPLLHPNGTMVNCQCTVTVTPLGATYSVQVSSNCDRISSSNVEYTATATATVIDSVTLPPATSSPSVAPPLPMTPPPIIVEGLTIPPATSFPPTASPWTPVPITTYVPATSVPVPPVTYQPGNLTVFSEGLWLSQGLSVRILAQAGFPVTYEATGGGPALGGTTTIAASRQDSFLLQSQEVFHPKPDGAAVFLDNRPTNPQGWIWVSNSEETAGGVGSVTFNAQGQVIDYRRILSGTTWNCNGGPTPWGTWISAEEDMDRFEGVMWQVDPYGVRQPEAITLGIEGGAFEAFAYDVRNLNQPLFFATEDDEQGALRRWTPFTVAWETDPWSMLHGPGLTEFLVLQPDFVWGDGSNGTFIWVADESQGRDSAKEYYQYSEGIDVHGNILTFVCKSDFVMFRLNLDTYTYQRSSTQSGLFDGQPDQVKTIIQDDGRAWLYFSEDYGRVAGIHALDEAGSFLTILEGPAYDNEPGEPLVFRA
jgi:Bacterial protein of unknown function (DUF839)